MIFVLSFCLEEILQWPPLLNEVNAWKKTCEKQQKSTTDQLLNFKYENLIIAWEFVALLTRPILYC